MSGITHISENTYLRKHLRKVLAHKEAEIQPPHGHYVNMSVQYTAIFHGCKNGNFQMKKCDIFLIFAQNIDREYTLEPPHYEYPRSMF